MLFGPSIHVFLVLEAFHMIQLKQLNVLMRTQDDLLSWVPMFHVYNSQTSTLY